MNERKSFKKKKTDISSTPWEWEKSPKVYYSETILQTASDLKFV